MKIDLLDLIKHERLNNIKINDWVEKCLRFLGDPEDKSEQGVYGQIYKYDTIQVNIYGSRVTAIYVYFYEGTANYFVNESRFDVNTTIDSFLETLNQNNVSWLENSDLTFNDQRTIDISANISIVLDLWEDKIDKIIILQKSRIS